MDREQLGYAASRLRGMTQYRMLRQPGGVSFPKATCVLHLGGEPAARLLIPVVPPS